MNIESIAVNADVKNKIVVIYDDMLCSGNTLIQSAKTYKDCGAKKIFFIGTHGPVLSSSVFKEDIIDGFYITNSHPNILKYKDEVTIHMRIIK